MIDEQPARRDHRYRDFVPTPTADRNRIVHALAALEAINDRRQWERVAPARRALEIELERER